MSEDIRKILILDNDETTGSYYILFSLYDLFALSHFGSRLDSHKTLEILVRCCEDFGIFRPGLRGFLKQILDMKNKGLIDKICLYTNQLDVRDVYHYPHWKTNDGIVMSVPLMISKMFCLMVNDTHFIDKLYTRPIGDDLKQVNKYPVKDLCRVFKDLYPNDTVNLSKTLFVDDLHHKKYIIDSSNSKTDRYSRCSINEYSRQLPKKAFEIILNKILDAHRIELHWHNSILKDSIESGWIHLNSNIENKNTGKAVLKRISTRVNKFFTIGYKDKAAVKQKNGTSSKRSGKREGSKKGKAKRQSEIQRRTRKRGYSSS